MVFLNKDLEVRRNSQQSTLPPKDDQLQFYTLSDVEDAEHQALLADLSGRKPQVEECDATVTRLSCIQPTPMNEIQDTIMKKQELLSASMPLIDRLVEIHTTALRRYAHVSSAHPNKIITISQLSCVSF